MLARLLAEPPSPATLAALRDLPGDPSPLGQALADLAAAARASSVAAAADEFSALFVGLTGGELRPYGSYYQSGFLHERPLAALRHDLAALGITRVAGASEPEDHVAALCETMHGLITGALAAPADLHRQRGFFEAHLGTWAPRFFADLESAESAVLYRAVARLGRRFLAVEADAFALLGPSGPGRPASEPTRALAGLGP